MSQQEDTFTNCGSSLFSTAVSVLQLKVRWLVVVGCRELVVITTCMQQQRYETHDHAVTKTISLPSQPNRHSILEVAEQRHLPSETHNVSSEMGAIALQIRYTLAPTQANRSTSKPRIWMNSTGRSRYSKTLEIKLVLAIRG